MPRSVAAVLALSLGLPILAFVAAAHAAGVNAELITDGASFYVVAAGAMAAILEIRRIADEP